MFELAYCRILVSFYASGRTLCKAPRARTASCLKKLIEWGMQQYVELCTHIVLTSTTHCAEKHTTLCRKAQHRVLKSTTQGAEKHNTGCWKAVLSFRFLELHLIVASCLQAGAVLKATSKVRGAAPKTEVSLTQPVLVSVCVCETAKCDFTAFLDPKWIFRKRKGTTEDEEQKDFQANSCQVSHSNVDHICLSASFFRWSQSLPWSHCSKKSEMEKKRKRRHDLFTNSVNARSEIWRNKFSFILSTFLATGEKKEKKGMSEETQQSSKHAMIGEKNSAGLGMLGVCVCFSVRAQWLKSFTHRCKSLKASLN